MIDHSSISIHNGLIVAGQRHVSEHLNMSASHYHEYYELYILEEGLRHYIVQGNSYNLSPWQCLLLPPFTMHHSFGIDEGKYSRVIVYFTDEALYSPFLKEAVNQPFTLYAPDAIAQYEIQYYLNHFLKLKDVRSDIDLEIKCHLLNLILLRLLQSNKLSTTATKSQEPMNNVMQYIEKNYNRSLHLDAIAKQFYISKYQLCRDFKAYTDTTIHQYMTNLRMMHARRLLQETNQSMEAIGKEVGFNSSTHFGRIFKKELGITPKQYKRKANNTKSNYS